MSLKLNACPVHGIGNCTIDEGTGLFFCTCGRKCRIVAVGGKKSFYNKGWKKIHDTYWDVSTISKGRFVKIGTVKVSGSVVSREMDSHHSIKGYEPKDIANKLAHKKWGKKYNPLIISRNFKKS